MANPRTSSDVWDTSDGAFRPYPNATPRRTAFAHALGIVGVLGTLALAIAAFVPRAPWIMSKVRAWDGDEKTSEPAPQPPAEVVRQVTSIANAPELRAPSVAPPATTVPSLPATPPVVAATPAIESQPTVGGSPAIRSQPTAQASPAPAASSTEHVQAPAVRNAQRRSEPPLTAREIERRKERYAAWLKEQGLEPVH
jgi:hypothetical protein